MVAEGAAFMVSGEWWIAFFPGLALMVALGVITGLIPALGAMRLKIAAALGRG